MMRSLLVVGLLAGTAAPAWADAEGVGLGVAAGVAYSNTENGIQEAIGGRFAWGFFVDIPLLETFYITPSTMIYEIDVDGDGNRVPVTDVDLNFKFVVPIDALHIGAGVTGGLSTGLDPDEYVPHWGVLGFLSLNMVANLDAFVLVQYKNQMPESGDDIADIHGYGGAMFRF